MTSDYTPDDDKQSTIEQTDGGIALYHRVLPDEGAPESVKSVWQLLKTAFENTTRPEIVLAVDIEGHRDDDDGELTGEITHFLTEFLYPVGAAVATEIIVNGEAADTSDKGIEAVGIESERTDEITSLIPDGMEVGDFVRETAVVSAYRHKDDTFAYVLIFEDQYTELSEVQEMSDTEILEKTVEQF
jgi:hypothetical protein